VGDPYLEPDDGCDKVSPGCALCYAETFVEHWRGITLCRPGVGGFI
jgi:protein gp37